VCPAGLQRAADGFRRRHPVLSRRKIKKALINQGFFISISQQSLFWRKPIYFPSGMDTKGCGFGGNNRGIVCGPEI
ncbi:hypothetical protein, partial [Aeromonas hydrophila]|uniref:hypothetical protein n=1 Tax=Aeromonas hydrophila TaxID=644 RepID=UPI0036D7C728